MGFDPVDCLLAMQQAGKGGASVTVEALTATENGTVTAPPGKAYSPVSVNVRPLGPAWTEFISATATSNIVESLGVLSQNLQAGKLYSVVIDKSTSDYIANQLVALSTYNNDGDITSWPTAFMRWKSASQGYNAMNIANQAYDAAIQVGDKFFICEV